jgi:cyanate permease
LEQDIKIRKDNFSKPTAIIACTWLLTFSMYSALLCVPPMEYIIRKELDISYANMGLLFSIPIAGLVLIALPAGFLADRFGIRKIAGIGAILLAIGSILRGFSSDYLTLVLFTCIFGIGFALIYPNLPKLVHVWFSAKRAGVATGIYSTGTAVGAALGLAITLPLVYPVTNTYTGVFLLWSIPAVLAAILWWIIVRDRPDKNSYVNQAHIDIKTSPGKEAASISHFDWKNKGIWMVAFMLLFNNIHFYTWSGWSPAMLMMKGAQPDTAALLTSVINWVSVLTIFLIPWAAYKTGKGKPFMWSLTIALTLISIAMMFVPVSYTLPVMLILGLSLGGTFPLILALPAELQSSENVGRASGIIISFGYIGGLIGSWLTGYIVDVTGSFNMAIIILIVIAVAWTVVAFLIPEKKRPV